MKRFSLFAILALACISMMAVPANRRPFTVKQSDGTELTVVLRGDEALKYYVTLDGKYLFKESNGDFSYATFSKSGSCISTNCLAHNKDERSSAEVELLSSIDYDGIKSILSNTHAKRSERYRDSAKRAGSKIEPKGEVLVPVLLVEYSDVKFSFKKDFIDSLLNEPGYKYIPEAYGSARDYFMDQSDSIFRPKFVVSDIITLPNNMSYYGANDSDGNDRRPAHMVNEAIVKATSSLDFSSFDNNGDGEVEFVYCIYAGYSEANGADENTIWPHQWEISDPTALGKPTKVDGVNCNVYACSSELNMTENEESIYGKVLTGIGTICHEFSHCLGLYDIYDVTGESGNWCMDEWDIMDNGNHVMEGYLPVGYNSYQRDVCGWRKLELLEKKGDYSMLPLTQGGKGYKIVNDANSNEYFILENRKREAWDAGLVNDGIMIIHVDYSSSAWEDNNINVTPGHPRFQIVPADNDLLNYYDASTYEEFYENMEGDLWPGKSGNTEFTNSSLPAAKVYTGGYLNKPVTNIKYENYVASFTFLEGFVDVPVLSNPTDITSNSFVANWSAVECADKYIVELYRQVDVADGSGEVETLLNEDFLGCSDSNKNIDDEIDAYTSASGWSGNNIYSETGTLRIGSSKNPGTLVSPFIEANGNVTVSFTTVLYNKKDTGVKLDVEILNEEGNVIASKSVVPTSNKVSVDLTGKVEGRMQVKFNTKNSTGKKRTAIDDIKVSAINEYKNELVESFTTNTTSYLFSNLAPGIYMYRVKACEGSDESKFSNFVKVIVGTTVGAIDGVIADNLIKEVFTLSGVKITDIVNGELPKLPKGIYIIKCGTIAKKVYIR